MNEGKGSGEKEVGEAGGAAVGRGQGGRVGGRRESKREGVAAAVGRGREEEGAQASIDYRERRAEKEHGNY